ncbi:hypothetical protein RR48_07718 [Papilio machaon]|uniref:Uncharacterized protein n=1 Tax=Papilio machaon TaxID=76193 RepID=A0A194QZ27_PAPMA|nr:hypothetical protein RR48_07718 [Papilio machaon]
MNTRRIADKAWDLMPIDVFTSVVISAPKLMLKSLIFLSLNKIDAWREASANGLVPVNLCLQRLWDEPLCRVVFGKLVNTSSDAAERARLLAAATWESGLWLQALPSPNLVTLLDNTTFSLAISLRLGLPTNHPQCCPCGSMVDRQGHHGLSCQRSAGRLSRHAALNYVVCRALVSINVPAILEPNRIARDDGKRPDGLTLVPWKSGRCLVWDATCVDTLAASYLHGTSVTTGATASEAQTRKRRKYVYLSRNYIFFPLAFET